MTAPGRKAARGVCAAGTPRPRSRARDLLRRKLLAVVAALGAPGVARACESCYGAADSPLVDGARTGVWALLLVTVTVQGGVASFFVYLWRRARRLARLSSTIDAEWNDLQRQEDGR